MVVIIGVVDAKAKRVTKNESCKRLKTKVARTERERNFDQVKSKERLHAVSQHLASVRDDERRSEPDWSAAE